jgi:cytidylate kinase
MKKINIAIDGPAGAGKSTVAKLVAEHLQYIYIDTGAMYRALTWKALQDQIDIHSDKELSSLLNNIDLTLEPGFKGQTVFINKQEVTEEIRSREVTNQVSIVASKPSVREGMLHLQRKLASDSGVVMDGRDIGTHVLPDAELKLFLSASIEKRAERRYKELKEKGTEQSLEQVKEEIRARDEKDTQREVAPLRKAESAIEIDTSGSTIEEVVDTIIHIVKQLQIIIDETPNS